MCFHVHASMDVRSLVASRPKQQLNHPRRRRRPDRLLPSPAAGWVPYASLLASWCRESPAAIYCWAASVRPNNRYTIWISCWRSHAFPFFFFGFFIFACPFFNIFWKNALENIFIFIKIWRLISCNYVSLLYLTFFFFLFINLKIFQNMNRL